MLESKIGTQTEATAQAGRRTEPFHGDSYRSDALLGDYAVVQGRNLAQALRSDKGRFLAALVVVDMLALTAAFVLAYWLRFYVEITVAPGITPPPNVYVPLVSVLIPMWLLLFAVFGLFAPGLGMTSVLPAMDFARPGKARARVVSSIAANSGL